MVMVNHSILRYTVALNVQHVLSLDDPDRGGHVGRRDIDSDTKVSGTAQMCESFRCINCVRLMYVLTSHTFVPSYVPLSVSVVLLIDNFHSVVLMATKLGGYGKHSLMHLIDCE